jgi:outer membrane protein TolC
MVKIGEYAPIDTIEAAIIFQSRLLDYQAAVNELQKSGNDLLFYMTNGQSNTANLTPDDIAPDDSLESYFNRSQAKLSAIIGAETSQHPSLLKYRALNSVQETDLRLKREMRKPQINVQYNLLALPQNNEFLISTNNYKWGLSVNVPLFRATRNDFKLSELSQLNTKLELQNKTVELSLKMAATRRTISIISEQITIADRNARYSRQLLEAEQLKFGSGESSLFLLAMRENKWLESELKLCEYKYKFVWTVMQMVYLSGLLNYDMP